MGQQQGRETSRKNNETNMQHAIHSMRTKKKKKNTEKLTKAVEIRVQVKTLVLTRKLRPLLVASIIIFISNVEN